MCRSQENRSLLVEAKRKYKVFVARQRRKYLRHEGNHLEYIRKCNPKLFYKKFCKPKCKQNTDLGIDDFYTHFRDLAGNSETDDDTGPDNVTENPTSTYPQLDVEVDKEEIVEAIKSSKCNKSPGRDGFIYEYFKEFTDIFVPILVSLFC